LTDPHSTRVTDGQTYGSTYWRNSRLRYCRQYNDSIIHPCT